MNHNELEIIRKELASIKKELRDLKEIFTDWMIYQGVYVREGFNQNKGKWPLKEISKEGEKKDIFSQ